MLKFWLKNDPSAEDYIVSLKSDGLLGQGFEVKDDHISGKRHFCVYVHVRDPRLGQEFLKEAFAKEVFDAVTFQESIYVGFRSDGVYHHKGAILMVSTTEYTGSLDVPSRSQEITVSATNMEELCEAYTLLRKGELLPTEDWTAKQVSPPDCETQVDPAS